MFSTRSNIGPTGIFENMIGFNPSLSSNLVSKTKVLPWLLERIQSKTHDENRGYAAELISIFLQNRSDNKMALGECNGVEIILKVLSVRLQFLTEFYNLTMMTSNIDEGILLMQKRQNSWKIFSMLYAPPLQKMLSRNLFLRLKVLI